MTYAKRLDLLIVALRRATPFGRRRMLATHARLIRRGIRLAPAIVRHKRTPPLCSYPRPRAGGVTITLSVVVK